MPLTYDQQKNLRSLIDNAGAGTYEEVRNELYDHLVQATESRMADGLSFTDAQGGALEEMGGRNGLLNIEQGYETAAKKQAFDLFLAYIPLYFKSLRWAFPIALAIVIKLYIPVQFYLWVSVAGILSFMLIMTGILKRWSYGITEYNTDTHPKSLRAFAISHCAQFLAPALIVANYILIRREVLDFIPALILVLVYLLADYCLAFVAHAKKTWLEVA